MDYPDIQIKSLRRSRNLIITVVGLIIVISLASVMVYGAITSRASKGGLESRAVLPSSNSSEVYLIAQRPDDTYSLFAFDPESGQVDQVYDAYLGSNMLLTNDKRNIYIYDTAQAISQGRLLRLDTLDRSVVWEVNVPGYPNFGLPNQGMWFSSDKKRIYLLGTEDGFLPRIYTIDILTGNLLGNFLLTLPYPSNEHQASPLVWKLPWVERMIVISRDKLFTVDLVSGDSRDYLSLFRSGDITRVPINLPRTRFVWDGELDSIGRRFYFVTSSQEIFSIDLSDDPYTVEMVFQLPSGWQFSVMDPLFVNSQENIAYIQVKRNETPIGSGLEVEEIWTLDMTGWTQANRLNFRERGSIPLVADLQLTQQVAPYPEGYGFTLTDENKVLFLTQGGIVSLDRGQGQQLEGRWVGINWGAIPKPYWYAVIP